MAETPKIVCPVCGQEYLPSEIYLPDDFLGKPEDIIKTTSGKIDFFFGPDMNLTEEYICDGCSSVLKIKANLSFNVNVKSAGDRFNQEYSTKITRPNKVKVEEESLF